jgi:hypothetical protein
MCEPGQPHPVVGESFQEGLHTAFDISLSKQLAENVRVFVTVFTDGSNFAAILAAQNLQKASSSGRRLVGWNQPTARNANPCPRFH